jgi:hypothetical protein
MLYRCCFLDANDGIEALEEIEADTLTDAIDDAKAMLKSRPQHESYRSCCGASDTCVRHHTSSSQEALAFGIVHEIREFRPPKGSQVYNV